MLFRSEILRMEARITLVKLSEKDPLFFLASETEPLSAWDMANLHSMLSKLPENQIPDFSTWLQSGNKSVVLFCISMIGAFKQHEATDVLLRMVDNDDEAIKYAVIKALREMGSSKAEEKLISMYQDSSPDIRHAILKSLESIASEKSIPLYEKILRGPVPELQDAILSVKALLSLGVRGKNIINDISDLKNERMMLVIQHASDARL